MSHSGKITFATAISLSTPSEYSQQITILSTSRPLIYIGFVACQTVLSPGTFHLVTLNPATPKAIPVPFSTLNTPHQRRYIHEIPIDSIFIGIWAEGSFLKSGMFFQKACDSLIPRVLHIL